MWPMSADHAMLSIKQKGPVTSTEFPLEGTDNTDFNHKWSLEWKLYTTRDSAPILEWETNDFEEPFTTGEYESIAEYLDEALDNSQFNYESGAESSSIDKYRKDLFERLELCKVVETLHGRCLDIHVWPHKMHQHARRSIHSIQWEQLEDSGLWKGNDHEWPSEDECGDLFAVEEHKRVRFVSVCRHFHPPQPKAPIGQQRGQQIDASANFKRERGEHNHIFDVLLVVARPHIHHVPVGAPSILNPATIRSVLLQLQDELGSTYSSQKLCLEIVRPGCVKELEAHLEKRRMAFDGRRPYHVIHFDMHGGVEMWHGERKAFLQFNSYMNNSHELESKNVGAKCIANILQKHHIDCVILNACKSAVAHEGRLANFSMGLLEGGIPAVLAMSHNMHDSISKRFYSKFYKELIVNHAPMAMAASKARKELSRDRERYSYAKGEAVRMQDWFIPVVYTSSEEPYRVCALAPWYSLKKFGYTIAKELGLCLAFINVAYHLASAEVWSIVKNSAVLCIPILARLGSHQFWDGIEDGAAYCPNPLKPPTKSQLEGMAVLWLLSIFIRTIRTFRSHWRMRGRLRVLAEDRQNVLRIEANLKNRRMVFVYREVADEDDARPLLHCLAAIWKRTSFLAFGGPIEAEWFVHPEDLRKPDSWKGWTQSLISRDSWSLWLKAHVNVMCFWIYTLGMGHSSATKASSIIIIENVDALYPENEVLKDQEHYGRAKKRFENWLEEQFGAQSRENVPYLMLTALRQAWVGDTFFTWFKDGPGLCETLRPIAKTSFVKISKDYVDRTNPSIHTEKWYDRFMSWISGDVSRPRQNGLTSVLKNLASNLLGQMI